jgi:hypothetical protein
LIVDNSLQYRKWSFLLVFELYDYLVKEIFTEFLRQFRNRNAHKILTQVNVLLQNLDLFKAMKELKFFLSLINTVESANLSEFFSALHRAVP